MAVSTVGGQKDGVAGGAAPEGAGAAGRAH